MPLELACPRYPFQLELVYHLSSLVWADCAQSLSWVRLAWDLWCAAAVLSLWVMFWAFQVVLGVPWSVATTSVHLLWTLYISIQPLHARPLTLIFPFLGLVSSTLPKLWLSNEIYYSLLHISVRGIICSPPEVSWFSALAQILSLFLFQVELPTSWLLLSTLSDLPEELLVWLLHYLRSPPDGA